MSVFGWLNDNCCGPLNDLVGAGVAATGLDLPRGLVGRCSSSFMTIKIFIRSVLIFAISYVQSHFPPDARPAGRTVWSGGQHAAALLGTLTPFCSCRPFRCSSASPLACHWR